MAVEAEAERMADNPWVERMARFGLIAQGLSFMLVGALAIKLAVGAGGTATDREGALRGILGWPGGRWIVGAIAAGIAGAALWNLYRAVSGQYKEKLKEHRMSETELRWTTRIAFAGLMSRAVVFGLISWFFARAAIEYDPKEAKGLDGALQEVADAPYGRWLLAIVAAGLFLYGVFCLIQARYREV